MQYSCVLGFGAKELTYDRSLTSDSTPQRFYTIHGLLYSSCGVAGIVAEVAQSLWMQEIARILFSSANIAAVLYYGNVLQNSMDSIERKSAALGLINNLGYLLATASYYLGFAEVVTLLLGCVALAFGGVKILYDAWHLIYASDPSSPQRSQRGAENTERV